MRSKRLVHGLLVVASIGWNGNYSFVRDHFSVEPVIGIRMNSRNLMRLLWTIHCHRYQCDIVCDRKLCISIEFGWSARLQLETVCFVKFNVETHAVDEFNVIFMKCLYRKDASILYFSPFYWIMLFDDGIFLFHDFLLYMAINDEKFRDKRVFNLNERKSRK